VRQVAGRGDRIRLAGIKIYDRTGGTLRTILEADRGGRVPGGWELTNVRLFHVDSGQTGRMARARLGGSLRPEQFTLASVDADEQTFWQLRRSIAELEAVGRPTHTLEASLWHKISGPLSALLMPLLGAIAAFGLARSGQLFVRAVIGMALGFAYFVADNFALAMGNFGAYPPFLAAWGPFLLFLLIGEAVLIRTEE
jgi:lipopolysaccharide export system permease protein